jgi:hypothetical protein
MENKLGKRLKTFHLVAMFLWIAVTPVTIKFPESVLWVALMSQYANFVGHFSGYSAERAEAANNG